MTEKELMERLAESEYQYMLAVFTDKADFVTGISDAGKLLALRAFDENGEFRAYRDLIGSPFAFREITAENESGFDGYFDETHYLDIDTTVRFDDDTVKKTTGGGTFHLPAEAKDKTMLRVRCYYRYDDEGIARKCDWRLVGFSDKEMV